MSLFKFPAVPSSPGRSNPAHPGVTGRHVPAGRAPRYLGGGGSRARVTGGCCRERFKDTEISSLARKPAVREPKVCTPREEPCRPRGAGGRVSCASERNRGAAALDTHAARQPAEPVTRLTPAGNSAPVRLQTAWAAAGCAPPALGRTELRSWGRRTGRTSQPGLSWDLARTRACER